MIEYIKKQYPMLEIRSIKRAMFMSYCPSGDDIFIVEMDNNTVFVFEYECGDLVSADTQKGTFEQFFALMPKFTYCKYEVFAIEEV